MDNTYCVCTTHNDNDNKMSAHFTHYADELRPVSFPHQLNVRFFSCVCLFNCKISLSLSFHPISSGQSQFPTMFFLRCDKNRIYFESTTWRWADIYRVFQRIVPFRHEVGKNRKFFRTRLVCIREGHNLF